MFDLGEGRVVHLDRGDPPTPATSKVRFLSGWMGAAADVERSRPDEIVSCSLLASFGGVNVVHLQVSRPRAVKPIRLVSPAPARDPPDEEGARLEDQRAADHVAPRRGRVHRHESLLG